MKCVQYWGKNKEQVSIVRVSDEVAASMVKTRDWKYCPKSLWKERERAEEQLTPL
jgi:hypothetical protein